MITKYLLAEQIHRMLGQNIGASQRVHINEIKILVGQVANQVLKIDQFKVNMPEGDTIPNNCVLYTYTDIPVVTYNGKAKSDLPFIPVSLPKNMGVYQVIPWDSVNGRYNIDCPYIPIPAGMYGILKPLQLIGDLSGNSGYEVFGSEVVYTTDISATVSKVMMRLVGVDCATLGDYDIMPLSADMQAQVVDTVYKMFVQHPEKERVADGNN